MQETYPYQLVVVKVMWSGEGHVFQLSVFTVMIIFDATRFNDVTRPGNGSRLQFT